MNAGNCKLEQGLKSEATREEDVTAAWALYEAALKQEPDCIEAIFNMSLAAKAMEQYDLALEQLIMLNGLMPNQVCSKKPSLLSPRRPLGYRSRTAYLCCRWRFCIR